MSQPRITAPLLERTVDVIDQVFSRHDPAVADKRCYSYTHILGYRIYRITEIKYRYTVIGRDKRICLLMIALHKRSVGMGIMSGHIGDQEFSRGKFVGIAGIMIEHGFQFATVVAGRTKRHIDSSL